ncbi:MAG: fibrobacter succinogenes major paralogous domain-containing protein [Bacteroidales bacterium]|nr:fibrobacter succinogenes major paralogous domain-containing protein [Bacteroidales bacterium]
MKYVLKKTLVVFLSVGMISLFHSCKKPTAPTVTTANVTEITETTAKSGGNVTSDGGADVTVRGVCWSTENYPTTADNKSVNGSGTGSFVSDLTGLDENTDYYVRAYAVNSEGTAYGDPVSFKTEQMQTVTDADGNIYDLVFIDAQVWMAENLKTTKFRDGTDIPLVEESDPWIALSAPGYCWYGNDEATNGDTYGALYNWYAVADPKGLCPAGFHVPTDDDWTTLITFAGGDALAGGKLKEQGTTHWTDPNTGATDDYDFTALPAGRRSDEGYFWYIGTNARWWSSTQYDDTYAWSRGVAHDNTSVDRDFKTKTYGMSIRCVKD